MDWQERNWEGQQSGYSYSTSVHSLEAYNALPVHFSYAFLGPVFDSISKPGYEAVSFDFSKKEELPVKLVGLGGIGAGNVKQVLEMGFDGAALLGAIWNSEDPITELKNCKDAIFRFPPLEGEKGGGRFEKSIVP